MSTSLRTFESPLDGILVCLPGQTQARSVVRVGGKAHFTTGPIYTNGRPCYPLPQDGVIVDATHPTTVEWALREHGPRYIGFDWLVEHDFATVIREEKFNRMIEDYGGGNTIDFQFDHPDLLAAGIARTYKIDCGEFHETITVGSSH